MRKRFKSLQCLIILLFPTFCLGQTEFDANSGQALSQYIFKEEITLITDRDLYSINEDILFYANCKTNLGGIQKKWSAVLYVELIKPNGEPVLSGKYELSENGASGVVHIPGNLSSGNYYLKAYTKWMRNFSVGSYSYTPLKIVNSLKRAVEMPHYSGTNQVKLIERPFEKTKRMDVHTDKMVYGNRDKVRLIIKSKEELAPELKHVISVVKKGSKVPNQYAGIINKNANAMDRMDFFNYTDESDEINNRNKQLFYPELRGASLSGRVIDRKTQNPVNNAQVVISMLGEKSCLMAYETNQNGRFFFTLPKSTSISELFVNAYKKNNSNTIEIDKEFCDNQFDIIANDFQLTSQEEKLASEFYINNQIIKAIRTDGASITGRNKSMQAGTQFYGKPNKVLLTQKYIELPNIEEFLFELAPEIVVKRRRDEIIMETSKSNSFNMFSFLTMIDNVPIFNLSAFLEVDLSKIERLEIVDNGYIIGDLKYAGIIHAYSKNMDMAGIDLPASSMFLQFRNYSIKNEMRFPDYSKEYNARIPDRRNCLYWDTTCKFIDESNGQIEFYTSDNKGVYQIFLYTISSYTGVISISTAEFEVK